MNPPTEIAPGLAVIVQPDTRDIARLAVLGYRTIINNRPDCEEVGQMPATSARVEAERLGLAYVHIPIMVGTIGEADRLSLRQGHPGKPKPGRCPLPYWNAVVPSVGGRAGTRRQGRSGGAGRRGGRQELRSQVSSRSDGAVAAPNAPE